MANVIKYIYTSVPANTVQVFPFVIGVNFGGYGSTAATGYWNGKTPNVGGYVVYVSVSPPSSPTIYVADNDTQLISLCNQLYGYGVTTVEAALQTFNNSTSTCCVNMDYPNIVTTNIGPNLDAGYTPSYPRSGTTWTDISGSGYTSTLVNGVSYGSGSLTFDGSDDAVTLPSTITLGNGNWSVCMWVSAGAFSSSGYGTLLSNNSGGPVTNAFGMINGRISYDYYTPTWNQQLGSTSLNLGDWYFLTWVNSSPGKMLMYVNGVVDCALFTSTTSNGGPVNSIGRNWTTTFNGKISGVSIYQGKSLTPAEVLQNYYAGLQRFIPTGGLVLYLDGNNTDKQVMTASTANDISGNNNNGTLTNGVALSRDGQRSFSFDGTNDYMSVPNSSSLQLSTQITISAWFKLLDTTPSGNTPTIIQKEVYVSGVNNQGFLFRVQMSNNSMYLALLNNNVYTAGSGVNQIFKNIWYNAVGTYDGTQIKFYLNGVLKTTTNYSGGFLTNTQPLFVGQASTLYYMWGNVGEVRIYNRGLTQTEVSTIYTATKSRYGY